VEKNKHVNIQYPAEGKSTDVDLHLVLTTFGIGKRFEVVNKPRVRSSSRGRSFL
jgi:hypothetical protein